MINPGNYVLADVAQTSFTFTLLLTLFLFYGIIPRTNGTGALFTLVHVTIIVTAVVVIRRDFAAEKEFWGFVHRRMRNPNRQTVTTKFGLWSTMDPADIEIMARIEAPGDSADENEDQRGLDRQVEADDDNRVASPQPHATTTAEYGAVGSVTPQARRGGETKRAKPPSRASKPEANKQIPRFSFKDLSTCVQDGQSNRSAERLAGHATGL